MEAPKPATYIGAEPCTAHIYLADGRRDGHIPTNYVLHYGDEEIEVTPRMIWDAAKRLFGGDGE